MTFINSLALVFRVAHDVYKQFSTSISEWRMTFINSLALAFRVAHDVLCIDRTTLNTAVCV